MAGHKTSFLPHPWMLRAVVRSYTWSPPLLGRRAILHCLLRVEKLSRILVAHPCWWEGEEAMCRAGIHNRLQPYLLSCRNHLSLQRAPIESTQTACSKLQQRGGSASDPHRARQGAWGHTVGFGSSQQNPAQDPLHIRRQCNKEWLPLNFCRARGKYIYTWKHLVKESGVF